MSRWLARGTLAALAMALTAPARADDVPSLAAPAVNGTNNTGAGAGGPRRTVWTFGFTGMRHSLKAGDGNAVVGNAGDVQLGVGHLAGNWFIDGSLDLLLGPFVPTSGNRDSSAHTEPTVPGSLLDTDFIGTGVTIWTGFSAQATNLRSPIGGYGFALGVSYGALSGHSVGKNRADDGTNADLTQHQADTNYTMNVDDLSLLPAIFFSWLTPERPKGNTPELLATRVEGYMLMIGAALPIIANYSATHTIGTASDNVIDEHGTLNGYSIVICFQTLLGT